MELLLSLLIENQLFVNSNFKTSSSDKISDLMNDPQLVDLVYSQIKSQITTATTVIPK